MRGRFITLEGGEGAGKSTQRAALAQALRERGVEVVETREPGGSEGAEAIRELLLTGSEERWGPRAEALLFAAARADHVDRTILPALARGAWVVSDRFVDSSRAYQSGASGLSDDDILTLHRIGSDGLMPDRTLVLVPSEAEVEARLDRRDGGKGDRIGSRDPAFHKRVREAFIAYAAASPERVQLIEADGAIEDVTQRLLAGIADLLLP